jgi:hypothetical protein
MSGSKIPTIIAITALAVAVLAATPLGQAAGRLVLPKNSVGAAQLKKNAVTGVKVKDGTLLAGDFKAGQLPKGPKGDPGQRGPKGDKGDPGATNVLKRSGIGPTSGAGGYSTATASCHAGEKLVGGGAVYTFVPSADPTLTRSGPDPNVANSWIATFRNDGPAGSVTAFAYALCAAP